MQALGVPLRTVGLEFGGLGLALFLLLAAGIVGYVVYVDAERRNNPNAVMVGLFVGIFTFLGLFPGFLALLLYMYGRGVD